MTDIPHFAYPFRFVGDVPRAAESEQDSLEEIADCVEAILRTEPGQLPDDLEFGVPDIVFTNGDIEATVALLQAQEPRMSLDAEREWTEELVMRLIVKIQEGVDG